MRDLKVDDLVKARRRLNASKMMVRRGTFGIVTKVISWQRKVYLVQWFGEDKPERDYWPNDCLRRVHQ